jgi:maltose alpha-D-glucosyltransferase/alpha-amylase
MRLNVGIRRRLAPLMENSRPRIELMTGLLFSLPGTPIIYYGDEIAMGDNVFLGDRNGVRTPMQWSSDRNAGFSRADPARLYAPPIMDPVYGYESINVESQERSPFSLLQWMKRMIGLRKQHQVFGRGTVEFISTSNRKILVYTRRLGDDTVLCVANLSRTVQPVEIPLDRFAGLVPIEILGRTEFPRIGEQSYFLTLAPYGFYWFELQQAAVPMTARTAPAHEEPAIVPTLFSGLVWDGVLDGGLRTIIERQVLVAYLQRQRWFGGKARPVAAVRFMDWVTLRGGHHPAFLTIVDIRYGDGGNEQYVLPLSMIGGSDATALDEAHHSAVLARISGARKGILYDGLLDDDLCERLLGILQEQRTVAMRTGGMAGHSRPIPDAAMVHPLAPISRTAPDQSNTSVLFGKRLIMKLFRRIEPGPHPELEVGDFLAARQFTRVPPLAGFLSYQNGSAPAAVAVLQQYVFNQGNGWQVTIEELGRFFERATGLSARRSVRENAPGFFADLGDPSDRVVDAIGTYLTLADLLGRRTGELHARLADADDDPAFTPEPYTQTDLRGTAAVMQRHAEEHLALIERSLGQADDRRGELARSVLARRDDLLRLLEEARQIGDGGRRIRCHGDYHLGQVLVTEGDVTIFDFEGEPARPLDDRRQKSSPLRDVAGMLRSFSYAAMTGLAVATVPRPEDVDRLAPWAEFWEQWVRSMFLRGYRTAAGEASILPRRPEDFETLLDVFLLDKALYEVAYELNNRPDWVHIPLTGVLRLGTPLHA